MTGWGAAETITGPEVGSPIPEQSAKANEAPLTSEASADPADQSGSLINQSDTLPTHDLCCERAGFAPPSEAQRKTPFSVFCNRTRHLFDQARSYRARLSPREAIAYRARLSPCEAIAEEPKADGHKVG